MATTLSVTVSDPVSIDIANTAATGDDIVCRYSENPPGRPTIPCTIRQFTGATRNITLNGEKIRFEDSMDSSSFLTLVPDTPREFSISGQTKSDAMNDAYIEVQMNTDVGRVTWRKPLTVLWVDNITLRNEQNADFSADNDSLFKPNPPKLGKQRVKAFPTIPELGNIVEISGMVSPSDFSKPLDFLRDNTGEYLAYGTSITNLTVPKNHQTIPRPVTPQCNDVSDSAFKDVLPIPNGRIYDLDTPGFPTYGNTTADKQPDNTVFFLRMNFKEYAIFNGVRCSDDFSWFSRTTVIKQTANGTSQYSFLTRPGHSSDNESGTGETTIGVD